MKRTTILMFFCVGLLVFAVGNLHAQFSAPLTDPTVISLPGPGYAVAVKTADFNGDGRNDILVLAAGVNEASCQTLLYMQSQTNPGTFNQPILGTYPFEVGLGLTAVDVKDLDNDGLPDVALAINNNLVILHNNSGGVLELGPSFYAGSGRTALKIVELDGDNLPEIVTKSEGEPCLGVFHNENSLQFVPVGIGTLPTGVPGRIAIGDINNDGLKDVVVMSGASVHSISIFYNSASGIGNPEFLDLGNAPVTLSVGQFDKLGGDDIAVTYATGANLDVLVWWSSQDLTLPPATAYCQLNTVVMTNAMFDTSNQNSIVQGHNFLNQLSVFLEFVPMMVAVSAISYTNFSVHAYDDVITTGDMNQNGQTDIALADSSLGLILMFIGENTTGINLIKGHGEVSVFPNPFTSTLTVKGATTTEVINIYNQVGQKIYSFRPDQVKNVSTESWPLGVYYIELIDNQGKRSTAKALKL